VSPARSVAHAALGSAVRQLREEAGMSQEGLGHSSGLDRSYVGGVERGERNPSYAALLKIAAALERPLSEVLRRAEQIS